MVELPHAARQAGKTEPGDLLHHRQGLLLDHSGKIFSLMAAWLNEVVVRAVALLSALTK